MYLEMFSDLDLVRTIDDDDEVPEDPDSASDDEAVSSLYSSETLILSASFPFGLHCGAITLLCFESYNNLLW